MLSKQWSPWNQKDIDLLEDVQKRVVRMTTGLKPRTYQDKLKELGLPSQEERRRGDMIQTWKILHQHDDVWEKTWFTRLNTASTVSTRLNLSIFNLEIKRTVFKGWNQLPEAVKGVMTLYAFKNSYDKHRNVAMDPE